MKENKTLWIFDICIKQLFKNNVNDYKASSIYDFNWVNDVFKCFDNFNDFKKFKSKIDTHQWKYSHSKTSTSEFFYNIKYSCRFYKCKKCDAMIDFCKQTNRSIYLRLFIANNYVTGDYDKILTCQKVIMKAALE